MDEDYNNFVVVVLLEKGLSMVKRDVVVVVVKNVCENPPPERKYSTDYFNWNLYGTGWRKRDKNQVTGKVTAIGNKWIKCSTKPTMSHAGTRTEAN